MIKTNQIIFGLTLCFGLSGLSSCSEDEGASTLMNPEPTSTSPAVPADASQEDLDKLEHAKNVFYSIPSPVEMAAIMKNAGGTYDYRHLNDVTKSNQYSNPVKQALNLGVFGADLSYTCIHNQTQETMLYMQATKKLSDQLGVSTAFSSEMMERIESNIEYKDSLMNLIGETFWVLDDYLKENDRENVSALIISGGWLEGLYLSSRLLDNETVDMDLSKKMAEQKFSLLNLVALLESYGEDEMLAETLADLKALEKLYEGVNIIYTKGEVTTDKETGVTNINGQNEVEMTPEQLNAVKAKIEEIRAKIIA